MAGICPLLAFVACWWTAAIIHMNVPDVPVSVVAVAAMLGLAVGIILDVLWLKRWMRRFYTASLHWMAAVYGALCVVAVASFMGLPIGTFGLGILAGIYTGRRLHHLGSEEEAARRSFHRVALFAALMTAGAALLIGLLVLRDQSVVETMQRWFGIAPGMARGVAGVAIVCVLSAVLFCAQYWCAMWAGRLAYKIRATTPTERTPEGG